MKKNLMNAALLGLLIATPACSFVSCKDYDEDFKKVNNRLDDLAAAKAKINEEIVALRGSFDAVNKKAADLEGKLANYATKEEVAVVKTDLNKAVGEISALTLKIKELESVKAQIESNSADIKELKLKLQALDSKAATYLTSADISQFKTLPQRIDNQQNVLDDYKTRIEALEKKGVAVSTANVDELKTMLSSLKDANYQTEEQVNAAIAKAIEGLKKANVPSEANVMQTGKVTSLMAQKSAIFDFGQGFVESSYRYHVINALDAANEQGVAIFTKDGEGVDEITESRFGVAEFAINPSTAKASEKTEDYTFESYKALIAQTRTETTPAFTVKAVKQDGNKLIVNYASNLNDGFDGEYGDMVALRYTQDAGSNTASVITSDYVRLVQYTNTGLNVGMVQTTSSEKIGDKTIEVTKSIDDCLADDSFGDEKKESLEFKVASDGTAFNIAEHVTTYTVRNVELLANAHAQAHRAIDKNAAADGDLKRAGFHYEYALVKANANDASTDVFVLNKTTGALSVKKDDYTNVGKSATVRVTLIDPNGKVASVGYFTAKVYATPKVLATITSAAKVPYNCDADSKVDGVKFSLVEVETALGAKLNEDWAIRTDEQFTFANKVAEKKTSAQGEFSVDYDKKEITLNNINPSSAGVNAVGDKYSTHLQVINKKNPSQFFLIELVWKPAEFQAAPKVVFSAIKQETLFINDAIRITADWKATNTYKHAKFAQDLNAAFKDLKLTLQDAANYSTVTQADVDANVKWIFVNPTRTSFVGVDGKTYELRANEDGTKFQAKTADATDWTDVATLTDGKTVVLSKNDVVRNLISKVSHKDFANSLTARVAYVSLNSCKKPFAVESGNQFDVKFLRPLDIAESYELVTFKNVGQVIEDGGNYNVHELNNQKLAIDWRNVAIGGANDHEDHFANFSATFKIASPENYLTNYQNVDSQPNVFKKVSETNMASHFAINVVSATSGGAINVPAAVDGWSTVTIDKQHWMLRVQYKNLGQAVSKAFEVRIPYVVDYLWGTAKGHFVVKFDPTVNGNANANARRK